MAQSCADALEKMALMVSGCDLYADYADAHAAQALIKWNASDYPGAILQLISAVYDSSNAARYAGGYLFPYVIGGPVKWYLLNCIEAAPYTLTMDAILSVMVTATNDEYRYFIGLVDAYRVGLWNKPFNAEFYAALARGFAAWE